MTEETGVAASPAVGRVLMTLWAAYFAAPFMLLFVLFVIGPSGSGGDFAFTSAGMGPLSWVFLGTSIVCAVTALFLRARMMRGTPVNTPANSTPADRVRAAWIVASALIEAGVLLGFVLAMIAGGVFSAVPFYVVWLPMMIWNMPTAARCASWLAAAGDPAVAAAPSGPIIR